MAPYGALTQLKCLNDALRRQPIQHCSGVSVTAGSFSGWSILPQKRRGTALPAAIRHMSGPFAVRFAACPKQRLPGVGMCPAGKMAIPSWAARRAARRRDCAGVRPGTYRPSGTRVMSGVPRSADLTGILTDCKNLATRNPFRI
jgi:hypothetical protein